MPLRQITGTLNIASGIIHTAKEYEVTDVIIGLHRKVNIVDSFLRYVCREPAESLHREVMIAKFLIPINTIRRIIIAVPPKGGIRSRLSEVGGAFCRMGGYVGLPGTFLCKRGTTVQLQALVKKNTDRP